MRLGLEETLVYILAGYKGSFTSCALCKAIWIYAPLIHRERKGKKDLGSTEAI